MLAQANLLVATALPEPAPITVARAISIVRYC